MCTHVKPKRFARKLVTFCVESGNLVGGIFLFNFQLSQSLFLYSLSDGCSVEFIEFSFMIGIFPFSFSLAEGEIDLLRQSGGSDSSFIPLQIT